MARLEFEDLGFSKEADAVKVSFLRIFEFGIPAAELGKIGKFSVKGNTISFEAGEKSAAHKFNLIVAEGIKRLRNKLNNKPAIYIHRNSGIPLIGHIAFGIVDRDTSILEVKPITSCNLGCIYCSVDEDRRPVDFVVEKDYLIEEICKVVRLKNYDGMEINIGTQGEPFLYSPLVGLIEDISGVEGVRTISINTNGTFLTRNMIRRLKEAGLTRINLSLNAIDAVIAKKIAGSNSYDVNAVLDTIPHIMKELDLIIAPVWIPGINDGEIPKIIEFCKSLKQTPRLMIQNFLNYKYGRNPVAAADWGAFEQKLREWEEEYGMKLRYDMKEEFRVKKIKAIKDPFKRGEIVKVSIVGPGRLYNESLGVARERAISVKGKIMPGTIRARITKIKDHLCYAVPR